MASIKAGWQQLRSWPHRSWTAGAATAASAWRRTREWVKAQSTPLIALTLVLALVILYLWPSIVITVHPGEAGVFYSRLFGGTVLDRIYGEGLHLILPWDAMYIYDTRIQEDTLDVQVLSRGGLLVNMKVSVFYYPVRDRLPKLHIEVGPNFREKLILPIVASSVRNIVGNYWPEDLYTSTPLKLQDEITAQVVEQMARRPVVVDNVVVRSILLPPQVNSSIDLKFSAEQEYLRYKFVLLKAGEELKRRYIEAESVRLFQETVNRGLTENFLRWSGIEATRELAASPNTKFVIMGGRDGLPVILNTEPFTGKAPEVAPKAAAPAPSAGEAPAKQGGISQEAPLINWDAFMKRLKGLEGTLQKLDKGLKPAPERTDSRP